MEKVWLICFFSLLAAASRSQIVVRFMDTDKKTPIDNVFVLNKNGETVSISNLKGECFILTRDMGTLKASHISYKPLIFKSEEDTVIYLKSDLQEVDAVTIKGMTNENLFKRILEISSQKVKKEGVKLEGIYFEMAYYIMENNQDTVHTIFTADMEAVLPDKKRSNYELYLSNEKKYLSDLSGIKQKFDTAQYNRALKLTGFIDNELDKTDLRDPGNIKLKKLGKSTRYTDSVAMIEFFREKGDRDNSFRCYYDASDSTALMTSYLSVSDEKYNNEPMWIDFTYYNSTTQHTRSPIYAIQLITIESEIYLVAGGHKTKVVGVKAFLVKNISEIDKDYQPTGKRVKNLFDYSSDFPASNEKLPILLNQTRF